MKFVCKALFLAILVPFIAFGLLASLVFFGLVMGWKLTVELTDWLSK